jgi:hypothetical protein
VAVVKRLFCDIHTAYENQEKLLFGFPTDPVV